jgi:hypothetical protein
MTETTIEERPRFLSLWLEELRGDLDERGIRALVPWWLLCFSGLSIVLAWQIPVGFFQTAHWDISTAVYAGALAFNGLLLALSWQAFARIQASMCAPGFSSFLKRRKLIGGYLFWIDYVQLSQVAAVCASATGLITILLSTVSLHGDRVIFGLVVGLSVYAVKNALDAMKLMHDLVWLHAEFDQMLQDVESANVTAFPAGGRGQSR